MRRGGRRAGGRALRSGADRRCCLQMKTDLNGETQRREERRGSLSGCVGTRNDDGNSKPVVTVGTLAEFNAVIRLHVIKNLGVCNETGYTDVGPHKACFLQRRWCVAVFWSGTDGGGATRWFLCCRADRSGCKGLVHFLVGSRDVLPAVQFPELVCVTRYEAGLECRAKFLWSFAGLTRAERLQKRTESQEKKGFCESHMRGYTTGQKRGQAGKFTSNG